MKPSDTCPSGHPFTGANLLISKRGHRRCATCKKLYWQRWYKSHGHSWIKDWKYKRKQSDFAAEIAKKTLAIKLLEENIKRVNTTDDIE